MGQEKIGRIDRESIKAVGAFGGGIASSGDICGILLGAVAMISSIYSRGSLEEKEDPRMWIVSNRFRKRFDKMTKQYGSMRCCDIAGVDWRNRDDVKSYYENRDGRRARCVDLVGEAARCLGELLEAEREKP